MSEKQELLVLKSKTTEMPYHWSVGREGAKFLQELRDNKKIFGMRCSKCGKVYVTPRRVCGPCFTPIKEWVELKAEGTLEAFSIVNYKFIDPNTGDIRPVPYTYGYIKLDGADSTLSHVVSITDSSKLRAGMRVKAVFNEERHGSLKDIKHFEPINGK